RRRPLKADSKRDRRLCHHGGRSPGSAARDFTMFKHILVPVDPPDTHLAKSAIETPVSPPRASGGTVRLLNVLPATPAMLAEYVPPDFDAQQRQSAEEALAIIAK